MDVKRTAYERYQDEVAPLQPDLLAKRRRKKKIIWAASIFLALGIIAAIVVAVLLSKNIIPLNRSSASAAPADADNTSGSGNSAPVPDPSASASPVPPSNSTTDESNESTNDGTGEPNITPCSTASDIPAEFKGTIYDVTSWATLDGFNCTFTPVKVGELPIVGLNLTWNDSAQANPNVPALDKPWPDYTTLPMRGVNIGGWLSLEPFITPSLFNYPASDGVIDEYTLTKFLGPQKAAETLEKHYSTFITEQDFKAIVDAGLDHVRIPFSYWAIETYEGDPYVPGISWRYLLRGIEWARKYGLRVNLDLHAVPGSQNGWNHSGRGGEIHWILSDPNQTNAQRSLEIHTRLSKFFAQPRYRNVVVLYGLVNEPSMNINLDELVTWTKQAQKVVADNGVKARTVFSDSMRGLPTWQGKMTGLEGAMVIDAHMYTIFDVNLIAMKRQAKVSLACDGLSSQVASSMVTASGFGPTIVGEWSVADTDCTQYLNGFGAGARWDGTFAGTVGSPKCPAGDSSCTCEISNDASKYSDDYKLFLKTFGIAQMDAYEKGWGWYYWTWKTEAAALWSYQAGLSGGFLPAKAYSRDWDCTKPIPSFGTLSEGQ